MLAEAAAGSSLEARTTAFVDEVVRPGAAACARGDGLAPRDLVCAAGDRGLAGLLLPALYGGTAAGHVGLAEVIEAVARVCASCAVTLDVHLSVGSEPIVLFGSRAQLRRHLPGIASGASVAAFALTEAGSGSDAAALSTRAEREGSAYRLTGAKAFITNCGAADLYVVMARTAPGPHGVTAFIVDAASRGVGCGEPLHKMGLAGSWTAELTLDGVPVSAGDRLGEEGSGFRVAMAALDSGRVGISAQAVGLAQGCLDDIAVAARRSTGVIDTALVADLHARTAAARVLTAHAARLADAGLPTTHAASIAKLYATDTAMAAAIAAVDLCAPESALQDHPAAIRLRDAKAGQIYEGTNQVQRMVIARQLFSG